MKGRIQGLIVIFVMIIILGVIDLFSNFVNTIPILGGVLETVSESIIESLQIILTGIGFFMINKYR